MIYYKQDDLIKMFKNNEIQVLIHGCNALCSMGAGIARVISNEFPIAYEVDKQTGYGNRDKMGTYSYAQIDNKFIVNAYTQFHYGKSKDNFDYDNFPILIERIKADPNFQNKTIGIPLIGCGLAGGDIEKIIPMLVNGFQNYNGDIYIVEIDKTMFNNSLKTIKKLKEITIL